MSDPLGLLRYIVEHTKCALFPVPPAPRVLPPGAVDVEAFHVSRLGTPTAADLAAKIRAHKGALALDLLDGSEHNRHAVAAWLGTADGANAVQRRDITALRLMALGQLVDLWELRTPRQVAPGMPEHLSGHLAMIGMITIVAYKRQQPVAEGTP